MKGPHREWFSPSALHNYWWYLIGEQSMRAQCVSNTDGIRYKLNFVGKLSNSRPSVTGYWEVVINRVIDIRQAETTRRIEELTNEIIRYQQEYRDLEEMRAAPAPPRFLSRH